MAITLNDTQRIILASAAARDTHTILPLPEGLKTPPVAVQRTLKALIAAGFVVETEEDGARITAAGLAAMGIADETAGASGAAAANRSLREAGSPPVPTSAPADVSATAGETSGVAPQGTLAVPASQEPATRLSKNRVVVEMLRRSSGVSIAEISDVTGWQAHSVRGFLTATVKGRMNLPLVSHRGEDGVRRYHIAAVRTGKQ
jgi:hypothetical protein